VAIDAVEARVKALGAPLRRSARAAPQYQGHDLGVEQRRIVILLKDGRCAGEMREWL
jgi:hypothetical protein